MAEITVEHQQRSPVTVLFLAIGCGAVAGLLMVLYEVVYNNYRGGIIPFEVGATLLVLSAVVVAFLIIGSALVAFFVLTRFLSGRTVIVILCAMVAAIVGGWAGFGLGSGDGGWIYPVFWTLAPTLYVALTFPRLRGSWKKA